MKIVFLSRVVFLGGVTTHLIDLSEEFIKQGHEVYLMSYGPRYKNSPENVALFNKLLDTGIKFIEIDFPIEKRSKIYYGLSLLKSLIKCHSIFKKYKFDIIHVHTPILSFIPKILGYKFVRTRHIVDNGYSFFDTKANLEIAVSREVKNDLIFKYNYSDEQVCVINNGVSKDEYYLNLSDHEYSLKSKLNYNLLDNELVIGLIGTFEYRKGHDILLKALAKLNRKKLTSLKVFFVGSSDEGNIKRLKDIIQELGLNNIVKILPFQPLRSIYSIIDIMVLPSRNEGFLLVAIEAMMMGCCVIRSDTPGASEQIKHGISGFIFENENVDQLAEYLEYLIQNPSEIQSMSKAGQKNALEKFTSEIMAKKTLDVYTHLLETR